VQSGIQPARINVLSMPTCVMDVVSAGQFAKKMQSTWNVVNASSNGIENHFQPANTESLFNPARRRADVMLARMYAQATSLASCLVPHARMANELMIGSCSHYYPPGVRIARLVCKPAHRDRLQFSLLDTTCLINMERSNEYVLPNPPISPK
jgi:hypothetical protein